MKLKITQKKSVIGALKKHKATIKALGLGKPNQSTVKPNNPQIQGMVQSVRHLITVEEVND